MSVLSDGELKARMGRGELVIGGDPDRASECSYSFVSGAAFLAGSHERPIEFPGEANRAEVVVKPGQMIWIRTQEQVAIPHDLVGLWWQTNGLSRKGLMLVNMSMVEPGYVGDLACLFVNFGKCNVVIGHGAVIAKMIFLKIAGETVHPFADHTPRERYDERLRDLAMNQPTSFLQVGERMAELEQARVQAVHAIETLTQRSEEAVEQALDDLRRQADKLLDQAREDTQKALDGAKDDAVGDFRKDIPKAIMNSFKWAVGGLALLTVATLAADKIKEHTDASYETIAKREAEEAVGQRVVIPTGADAAAINSLSRQIETLNARIETLEKRK